MKRLLYLLILTLVSLPGLCRGKRSDAVMLQLTGENFWNTDLDTNIWKFSPGDDIRWAAKDFNDSAWVRTSPVIQSVKKNNEIGFKGFGWFRLTFHADSSFVRQPLLIQFVSNGAAELYLDGVFVRRIGTLKKNDSSEYIKPFFPAIFAVRDTGIHVLAIRYENIYYESLLKSWRGNNAGFYINLYEYYSFLEAKKENITFFSLFFLISGGIFIALFLSHLVMYFFHKKYLANLIFSIFNLGLGVFFIVAYLSEIIEVNEMLHGILPLFVIAPAMSFFALNRLGAKLFLRSRIRLYISLGFLLVVVACAFIYYNLAVSILLLYLTYAILEATILVIVALRRKIPGAGILSFGILSTFLLFAFILVFGLLNMLSFEGNTGVVVLVLAMLTIFSLPFSMSAYLAWSFATVNKSLAVQLDKVSELSQKTLEQEQEKQRILETQKDDLERQVTARTSELVQQKEALVNEKKKSDDLLLNILPFEIAEELKATGYSKAQQYDKVSVLFTDFVNFTQISELLGVDELLAELNINFTAFDNIMDRYGLEKIKTIGDAYLAVSGLPLANPDHARNAVHAALDIIDFVTKRKAEVVYGLDIRIGINSGALIAGIVGVKKFAYDIWGDTVNTAARMEQNSEAGKVNISESTYLLVKDDFDCVHRGKIDAKNKGNIDMYFVTGKK